MERTCCNSTEPGPHRIDCAIFDMKRPLMWGADQAHSETKSGGDGEAMTLAELRSEFEDFAVRCMFDIRRRANGEYYGQTFILWAGYWECAVKRGVLAGEEATVQGMHR